MTTEQFETAKVLLSDIERSKQTLEMLDKVVGNNGVGIEFNDVDVVLPEKETLQIRNIIYSHIKCRLDEDVARLDQL